MLKTGTKDTQVGGPTCAGCTLPKSLTVIGGCTILFLHISDLLYMHLCIKFCDADALHCMHEVASSCMISILNTCI